jgi:uncharacterized protein
MQDMSQRTVAIVGASADRGKFSNKSIRAHLKQDWSVYPVNPKGGRIEGLTVYPTLGEIPVPLDRISMYLPPVIGIKLLPEIAAIGPQEFFLNPGAESDELVEEARRLGLDPIQACSIVDVGESPANFPDR